MAGGAAGPAQCLSYAGCNFLRQRLVLATLSGRPLKIRKIRAKEEDPGLRGERGVPPPGEQEGRRRRGPGAGCAGVGAQRSGGRGRSEAGVTPGPVPPLRDGAGPVSPGASRLVPQPAWGLCGEREEVPRVGLTRSLGPAWAPTAAPQAGPCLGKSGLFSQQLQSWRALRGPGFPQP